MGTKKVAVIQDLSGFGRCSLTAAIPVLSVMGIQPCPLPTAILSAQTGFPDYYCEDHPDRMEHFRKHWKKMNVQFDGIYTGFVASETQIYNIFRFLDSFYTNDTFLLVDPVMGDDGNVYDMYSPRLCGLMKELALKADIITPNVTELCLLTESDYHAIDQIREKEELIEKVRKLADIIRENGPETIVVTGLHYIENDVLMMGNLAVQKQKISMFGTPKAGGSYSGTGDLYASVITGGTARGDRLEDVIRLAGDFLNASILASPAIENGDYLPDGVDFEQCLGMLL